MNERRHIRSHQVKLSSDRGDFGFKTLCGTKQEYAETKPLKQFKYCHDCIRLLMMKKEDELRELERYL